MEFISVIMISIFILVILKFAWNLKLKDIKKLKTIGYSQELSEITNQLPENKEIAKAILKKLNHEKVTIKEEKQGKASFYIVVTNSISIANSKDSFTRVQTIAHECIHSIQNKTTLWFNFIFSNFYLLYFIVLSIATIMKLNSYPMLHLFGLTIFSFIYYAIRSSLEMDAMLKAKYLAKEYMQEEGTLTKEEQKQITENNEMINQIAIPFTNFHLILSSIIKIILYSILALIF